MTGQVSLWNRDPLTVTPVPGLQVLPHLPQCCKSVTFMLPPSLPRLKYERQARVCKVPCLPLLLFWCWWPESAVLLLLSWESDTARHEDKTHNLSCSRNSGNY